MVLHLPHGHRHRIVTSLRLLLGRGSDHQLVAGAHIVGGDLYLVLLRPGVDLISHHVVAPRDPMVPER